MASYKLFHLQDILSIFTGTLAGSETDLYSILDFMTGSELSTAELESAADECRVHLLKKMPWLAEIDLSGLTTQNWEEWLAEQTGRYGEYHKVSPIYA